MLTVELSGKLSSSDIKLEMGFCPVRQGQVLGDLSEIRNIFVKYYYFLSDKKIF